jgi:hypothetical protein
MLIPLCFEICNFRTKTICLNAKFVGFVRASQFEHTDDDEDDCGESCERALPPRMRPEESLIEA